ncbi:SpaA isopeptide-forming pilin-related protein [Lactococcus petauri]|uniref:SpaA isopeptide-forming pilin-related protein n=1 Tax=Lactococcus petauri TaxID=1940789 RepID=UPI001F56E51A|nr:SpaA isopeptide-forming pilin-related protein [Lactococcus petauri]
MQKHKTASRKLRQVLKKKIKATHCVLGLALAVGVGTVVHAVTLPAGNTQIGTIGSAPVVQTTNNSFNTMQPLFDALVGTQNPNFIVGDTHDGTGGKALGWNSSTSYAGTAISNANSQVNGSTGLSYDTIRYGLMVKDGFQAGDKFNYVSKKGQEFNIQNVGTAYNTKTGKNNPIGLEVKINDATYYDAIGTQTPRNVFNDHFRLLMAARNNGGTVTLGTMVSMDGIPNPGTGQGGEGGGSGTGSGTALGAASGIPESVRTTTTLYDMTTKQNLPANTLVAMKVSDIDAGQAAQLGQNSQLGYVVSKPTNLAIQNNVLTAKGTGTVVSDNGKLNANSYIALYKGASTFVNFVDTHGNMGQGNITLALFGNTGSTSPRQPLGYLQLDKTTQQYGKNLPNSCYNFTDLKFQVLDKNKKVVDTLTLNASGTSPKSKGVLAGEYTLHEVSDKWAATGQTQHADIKVTVKAGETTKVSAAQLTNQAVQGKLTIKKTGVESGTAMWNSHYTLAGNTFEVTAKSVGKVYTVTLDKNGQIVMEHLPLDTYRIKETKASDGFARTFEEKEVTLSYKDPHTEVVFGEVRGENQEVKGENTLSKSDKATDKNKHGQGDMSSAKYAYFYDDDATGSSPHKKGDPVKWTDTPHPKVLKGTKATEAVINGQKVNFGDQVVLDVDDTSLEAALGNLAIGKYMSKEIDAGEGYTVDPTEHHFEITKKDDQTVNIVTPQASSKEQLIQTKLRIRKEAESEDGSHHMGFNGVEFTATPIHGTQAQSVTVKTGIDPLTDDDGYATFTLPYGEWKIEESKGIPGYQKLKPLYVRMTHDVNTDLLTVEASNYEDYSTLLSTRTFRMTDDATGDNPQAEGLDIAANLDSGHFTASLSTIHAVNHERTIQTEAVDRADEDKVLGVGVAKIKDTVRLSRLQPSTDYQLIGEAVNAKDGQPLLDEKGQPVRTELTFTSDRKGSAIEDLETPEFSTVNLQGEKITMLETVKTLDGKEVLREANWKNNPGQTVVVAKVQGYTEVENEEKTALPELSIASKQEVRDTYHYEGLAPGQTYTVKVGEAAINHGKTTCPVKGQVTFTPEHSEGTVEMSLEVDTSDHAGEDLTFVNEKLYFGDEAKEEKLLFTRNDPQDKKETVHVRQPQPHKDVTDQPEKCLKDDRLRWNDAEIAGKTFKVVGDADKNQAVESDEVFNRIVQATEDDPYVDQKKNNAAYNLNTQEVKKGQKFYYVLTLDTLPYTVESLLTTLTLEDTLDGSNLEWDVSNIKVYDGAGQVMAKDDFKCQLKDKTLSVSMNRFKTLYVDSDGQQVDKDTPNAKAVKIIDTTRLPLGQQYKVVLPVTVKTDAKEGSDIINRAKEIVTTSSGKTLSLQTETRVNAIPTKNPLKKLIQKAKRLAHTGAALGQHQWCWFVGVCFLLGISVAFLQQRWKVLKESEEE